MAFDETALFPTKISYASRGGPGFRTSIIELDSGHEQRVAHWEGARHSYNVAYGIRSFAELAEVKRFFMARRGAQSGFRFLDPFDQTSKADGLAAPANQDQLLGTGNGSQTVFPLIKRYTDGVIVRNRTIQKPVSGTVTIAIDGVGQGSGWSVDTVTGLVSFNSAPGIGQLVTAGYRFHVPVRFGAEADRLLEADLESLKSGSLASIPIVEIVDDDFAVGEFYYGGADSLEFDADIHLREARGFTHVLTPLAGGLSVRLPSNANLPPGGPYFWIHNASEVHSLTIRTFTGASVAPLAAGDHAIVVLGMVGSSKIWFAAS